MTSCEGTGKSIELAIEDALLQLKASREDVDIKILNEGGFLKKAKVLVTISADAIEKYEKRAKLKEESLDEDFAETFMKKKVEEVAGAEKEAEEKTENDPQNLVQKENKNAEKESEKFEKKSEKSEEKATKKSKVFADDEISDSKETDTKQESKEKKQKERKFTGEEFLQAVLKTLGLSAEIEKTVDDRFEKYSLTGEGLSDLIGYHGECMLALSSIMNTVCKTDYHRRILLDVENYRQKREESLTALAHRVADKVAKSGRYQKLEPMDASERKIIHTALQNDDRVTTLSKGEEPRRFLIVFPKEYPESR